MDPEPSIDYALDSQWQSRLERLGFTGDSNNGLACRTKNFVLEAAWGYDHDFGAVTFILIPCRHLKTITHLHVPMPKVLEVARVLLKAGRNRKYHICFRDLDHIRRWYGI